MQQKVFISFSSKDAKIAASICAALEAAPVIAFRKAGWAEG